MLKKKSIASGMPQYSGRWLGWLWWGFGNHASSPVLPNCRFVTFSFSLTVALNRTSSQKVLWFIETSTKQLHYGRRQRHSRREYRSFWIYLFQNQVDYDRRSDVLDPAEDVPEKWKDNRYLWKELEFDMTSMFP